MNLRFLLSAMSPSNFVMTNPEVLRETLDSNGKNLVEGMKMFISDLEKSGDVFTISQTDTSAFKVGGNLAEILEGLAKVIRARFKLFRRVKAITAEAKWSGMFLSGFPIGALVMINVIQPNYYDEVRETSAFIPAALVVCAFLVINVVFMKIMVNIKV